jgi:hypothetical protein
MSNSYGELTGLDRRTWFILDNLFALGATYSFVGSLSDLFCRRYVTVGGGALLTLGNIITATAKSRNFFIDGMVIAGVVRVSTS